MTRKDREAMRHKTMRRLQCAHSAEHTGLPDAHNDDNAKFVYN